MVEHSEPDSVRVSGVPCTTEITERLLNLSGRYGFIPYIVTRVMPRHALIKAHAQPARATRGRYSANIYLRHMRGRCEPWLPLPPRRHFGHPFPEAETEGASEPQAGHHPETASWRRAAACRMPDIILRPELSRADPDHIRTAGRQRPCASRCDRPQREVSRFGYRHHGRWNITRRERQDLQPHHYECDGEA